MNTLKLLFAVVVVAAITGCAHPLTINPDIAKIAPEANSQPTGTHAGYYIPSELRDREVTTPGGGGDKVSYTPYKDMETAFYKMLGNVFSSVTPLKSTNDADTISKNSIAYIITPEITTNSTSPSAFTWPPTKFTVDLTCNINDSQGKSVKVVKVSGEGAAEFDEFKSDVSLSGRRASLDALQKMQKILLGLPELRVR